jgi:GT2 family glycosyltransferase/glycosyltransferase involved in cell wall biosynthesis
LSPTDEALHDDGYSVPRFMYYLWRLRPDLRQAFDVYDRASRLEYCKWFVLNAPHEYAVPDDLYSNELLVRLAAARGSAAARAQAILRERNKSLPASTIAPVTKSAEPELVQDIREDGANLIGYCRGEFGMGEQVRAMARALSAVQLPFSMIDSKAGSHGSGDDSAQHWIKNAKEYRTNIFCINADTFPFTYFSFGKPFFSNSYNIGYWAWELAKCPAEFDLALNMVDEVWAISEFVTQSFLSRSTVPVIRMPQAVSLPVLRQQYSKSYFGLVDDCFQFMFIFDAASRIDRKNPIAVVRAFRLAFPRGDEKVHLLLKTMNTHSKDPLWSALIAEAKMDSRIRIIDKRFERDKLLGLASVCDAFVSLHRSEGFGFNLAEAMVLGKPVIATNYSGSREFAREGTACVVDYQLVPVPEDSYPFSQQQFWAEPDIGHAAKSMRRLVNDDSYRDSIARSGQRFVIDNFNEATIGARYAARLAELRRTVFRSTPTQSRQRTSIALALDIIAPLGSDDEIIGFIDHPAPDGSKSLPVGSIDITGWAASKVGIKSIEIFCDGISCGIAFQGVLRPDIGVAFPDFKDSGRAGYFWILDATPLAAGRHVVRVVARSNSGRSKEWTRNFGLSSTTSYQQWLTNNTLDPKRRKRLIARTNALKIRPAITILMLCRSMVDRDTISRSLASLAAQLYQNFKVVIAVAKTEIQCIQSAVDTEQIADRIQLLPFDRPHLVQGLYNSDGDFVGVMDFDDVLEPRALLAVVENIARDDSIDFLYADEDRHRNRMPTFKPAFSPIYLDRYNYIGRPWFARTSLIKKVIEETGSTENLSEHEVVKRLGRTARAVCHIPMVLVSRSADMANSAGVNTQPVEEPALVGTETLPPVSIVIPTCLHKYEIVTRCFNGLVERTNYPNFEVIVVLNNVRDMASARAFLAKWPFTVRVWEGAFNWAGINNFGAKASSGDYLLFLNDDVEPVDPSWLRQMVRIACLKSVGAVGATLKYPNNVIQHGGITISNYADSRRHCGRHIFRFCTGDESHITSIVHHDHECRAVTGACLLTRRDCFNELSGFDESLEVVTNDTDYCLRLDARGYVNVISAAVLTHHEGISRTGIEEVDDLKRFWKRWSSRLSVDDPFTNPNLDRDKDDWSVSARAIGTLVGRITRQADVSKILAPEMGTEQQDVNLFREEER